MQLKYSLRIYFFCAIVLLSSLAFNYSLIKNILYDLYAWHLIQPESVQGGLMAIAIFTIIVLVFKFVKSHKIKMLLVILISILYLKLNLVLVPSIISLLYFEMIISSGRLLTKTLKISENNNEIINYFNYFLFGLITWCLIALIFSLLGLGSIHDLKIAAICLGLISILFSWKVPASIKLINSIIHFQTFKDFLMTGFLLVIVLIQFAKTNRALDYDSLWYGLRPEMVLFGPNSFFDNLGMTMIVHFYPKLFELFAAPLSNWNDYSFLLTMNVWMLVLLYLIVYHLIVGFTSNRTNSLFFVCLIASIPMITNMASTAKTDIFTTALILLSVYYMYLWQQSKNINFMLLSITSAILSLGGKPTSFLYVPLVFLGFILFLFLEKNKIKISIHLETKKYFSILVLSIFILIGIFYRTYIITGYPLYPLFNNVFKEIGFNGKYPFNEPIQDIVIQTQSSFLEILKHWYKLLFDPISYSHYVMVWPGNLGLFMFICSIIVIFTCGYRILKRYLGFSLIILPLIMSVVYYGTFLREGGDGNYYMLPIILCLITFFYVIQKNTQNYIRKCIFISLAIFIPFQTALMFVSHWSWSYGTEKFQTINLLKSDFETSLRNKQKIETEGLENIENFLSKTNKEMNCIGIGKEEVMNQLSCRFEDLINMNSRFGVVNIFSNDITFQKYLKWANVKYIILPNSDFDNRFQVVKNLIAKLNANNSSIMKIRDKNYTLYDIGSFSLQENLLEDSLLSEGWYEQEKGFRWIANEASGVFFTRYKENIIISGLVPEAHKSNVEMEVSINNKSQKKFTLPIGPFEVRIEIPKDEFLNLTIKTNASIKQAEFSQDKRNLSLVIYSVVTE